MDMHGVIVFLGDNDRGVIPSEESLASDTGFNVRNRYSSYSASLAENEKKINKIIAFCPVASLLATLAMLSGKIDFLVGQGIALENDR